MRLYIDAVNASSSRGRSSTILRLYLHQNPAQRRQFDSLTESDCRRRGFLALIRHQNFYLRKREQRLVPMGEDIQEREVASGYLHSYLLPLFPGSFQFR